MFGSMAVAARIERAEARLTAVVTRAVVASLPGGEALRRGPEGPQGTSTDENRKDFHGAMVM